MAQTAAQEAVVACVRLQEKPCESNSHRAFVMPTSFCNLRKIHQKKPKNPLTISSYDDIIRVSEMTNENKNQQRGNSQ